MNDVPLPPTQDEQAMMSQSIPRPKTPGLSFLRVISLIALLVSVTSFISFISAVADFTFPSQGFDYYNPYDSVKESLPLFIASFLALIFALSVLRYKRVKAHDTTYSLAWRRVLYTIFTILGFWVLGGLTYIISQWLEGDLAVRTLAKGLATLVVIAAVGFYYSAEMKGVWVEDTKKHIRFLGGLSLVVLVVIITAFFFIGSPSFHRNVQNDIARRYRIEEITYYINCGCHNGVLPADDAAFRKLLDEYVAGEYKDVLNQPMTYKKDDETHYQICGNFALDSKTVDDYQARYNKYYTTDVAWSYEKNGCQQLELHTDDTDVNDNYYDDVSNGNDSLDASNSPIIEKTPSAPTTK